MGLKKLFKIKPIFTLLLICALGGSYPAFSQASDSTRTNSITGAVKDSATAAPVTPAKPLISTDVDTTQLSWTGGGIEVPKPAAETSAEYKSAGYYVLLFLLFCVFLAIIGRVLRVYELTNGIQGKASKINWNKIQSILFGIALIAGLYGVYWSYTVQGAMSVTESASVHGKRLDFMFNVTLIITTIVFILTHIALFGFAFRYPGSDKRKAYFYPHNNALERVWTIVPAIVLTVLVLLGFFTWRSITNVPEEEQRGAISMEVTGEQFKWNIRYAGDDNQLGVKNYKLINANNNLGIDFKDRKSWDDKLGGEIMLPVNRPVRVTIGSKDIIHSFLIPDFKVQINAVPGMATYFQFTPTMTTAQMREKRQDPAYDYVLLCNKICGEGHYNMQAKVTVVTEEEYKAWLAKQPLFYNDEVKQQLRMAEQKAAKDNTIALNK
ncbi:MAG: cytochrome c oxidase subunit [Sphingobacteriaceae bacterium]|nr:cytochrome c oxidase subunit [Sphingobacteriaceae bacterium]